MRASREGDRSIDFIKRRVFLFFVQDGFLTALTAFQARRRTGNHLHAPFVTEGSLRLTWGDSWTWRIALNGVSANVQPPRLIQPCRR